ncbi:MAG: SAM-dependent methyltransferase [Lentisphaeria bacterium]|nr:SAM-dependent methyltransferase [Lentisphaeria bacterium]
MADRVLSSFRDPSGYVFRQGDGFFRRITSQGLADHDRFVRSGLADELLKAGLLVPFEEISRDASGAVLRLETLPFISYPYEWSFGQLRDAAALTLEIMRRSLEHDMVLKDASAFNVAFRHGRPIFLDHTSFMVRRVNEPWRAYRQFVTHFLNPLLLMRKVDLRCLSLFRTDLGGIPLDLTSKLLPRRTWFDPNILIHVHLHARFDRHYSADPQQRKIPAMSKGRLTNMIWSLEEWIRTMPIPKQLTQWEEYYGKTSYTEASFQFKKEQVEAMCRNLHPDTTLDLGANTGVFSEVAARYSKRVIAADCDAQSVEQLYRLGRSLKKTADFQPLLLDLNNPSPAVGVFNEERMPFFARCRSSLALGLALIHHLRITGNWTPAQIARLFSCCAPAALVEFVPREDVQVKRLMRGREEFFEDWTLPDMLEAFRPEFPRIETVAIPGSPRTLIKLYKD